MQDVCAQASRLVSRYPPAASLQHLPRATNNAVCDRGPSAKSIRIQSRQSLVEEQLKHGQASKGRTVHHVSATTSGGAKMVRFSESNADAWYRFEPCKVLAAGCRAHVTRVDVTGTTKLCYANGFKGKVHCGGGNHLVQEKDLETSVVCTLSPSDVLADAGRHLRADER